MSEIVFGRLEEEELDLVKPLLVSLEEEEQVHFPEHPQLTREELAGCLDTVQSRFFGENVVFAARQGAEVVGFCWVVLFDPGTGLEGEVAEVYVSPQQRRSRLGEQLVAMAVDLFRERAVTLGYVWTRSENDAATRLYQGAGFAPTRQLVLTWYPEAL